MLAKRSSRSSWSCASTRAATARWPWARRRTRSCAQAFKDLDQIKADVVYPVPARGLHRLRARHTDRATSVHEIVRHGDLLHLPPGGLPHPDQLAEQDLRRLQRSRPQGPLRRQRQGALPGTRRATAPSRPTPSSRSAQDQRPLQLPPPLVLPPPAREPRAQGARHDRGLHDRAHPAAEREPVEGVARRPRRRLAGRASSSTCTRSAT